MNLKNWILKQIMILIIFFFGSQSIGNLSIIIDADRENIISDNDSVLIVDAGWT